MVDKVKFLLGRSGNGNGSNLKCDLKYFKTKLSYIEMVGAQIYQLKKKGFLTEKEREELALLVEALNLHLRDLHEKCGVSLSAEQVLEMFKLHPDYLDELAATLLPSSTNNNNKQEKE